MRNTYIFLFLLITQFVTAQADITSKILNIFPDANIKELPVKNHYEAQYMITIEQPLDHCKKRKGYFPQRIFLSHYDFDAPMLFVTEGYSAGPRHYELSDILKSNQIIVEYRFNGGSKPDSLDYTYLTNEQAMRDLHRINKKFKKLYSNKWVSTGISKGGTTCLMYKATYPKDVDAAVPYVAPLPFAREDERMDVHIKNIGEKECRDKLEEFQHLALAQRDSILYYMRLYRNKAGLTFNRVDGIEKAFEYSVLELTFSFWQMGHSCDEINEKGSAKETYNTLMDIVGIDFYADGTINYFEPAFYQFMTQNGYYGFIHDHLVDELKEIEVYDNSIFGPRNVSLDYNPKYGKKISKKLKKRLNKTIQIHGEYDPWAAVAIKPDPKTDALFMVNKKGSHSSRIKDLDEEQRELIYRTLERWLEIPIYPLNVDNDSSE